MLRTLEGQSETNAERVLASLIQRYLPKPIIRDEGPDDLQQKVLSEVLRAAKVDPADRSEEAQSRVLRVLSDQLSRELLKGPRLAAAKARLGERGELTLNLYRIGFEKEFSESEKRGARKGFMIDAARNPDSVQHLDNVLHMENDDEAPVRQTLFTKTIRGKRRRDAFTWLIHAVRSADELTVAVAWRVYHEQVNINGREEPLEIMRQFVDRYGLRFTLADKAPTKLIIYDVLPEKFGDISFDTLARRFIRVDNPHGSKMAFFMAKAGVSLGMLKIILWYVLDQSLYDRDLQSHGVSVPREV